MRVIALALLALLACGRTSAPDMEPRQPFFDPTGADFAKWDSLSKTFATPPRIDRIPLPPMPVPARMKQSSLDVLVTVDETGQVIRVSMTPAKDPNYASAYARIWRQVRFTPAMTREGSPTKGYMRVHFEF